MEDVIALHINELPNSVLVGIFRFLSSDELRFAVQLVCRYWRALSHDRTLWRHCFSEQTLLNDGSFRSLLEKVGHCVEVLDLDNCFGLTEKSLSYVADLCTDLCEIRWKQMPVTKTSAEALRRFVISRPELRRYDFSNDICGYPEVLELCTGNLDSLSAFTSAARVDADIHEESGSQSQIMAASILAIAKQNPGLRHLMTNYLGRGDWLYRVCACCTSLETLSIRGAVWTSTDSLLSACDCLVSLTELCISETLVDDRCVGGVASRCPRLRRVDISACRNVTDTGIIALTEACPGIVELALNNSRYVSGNVTDLGLCSVASNLPHLRRLWISFCPSVSPSGVRLVAEKCPDLEEIHTVGCVALTEPAFLALAAYCKKLRMIDASQCLQLRSRTVEVMLLSLPSLTTLLVESCRSVSELRLRRSSENDSPEDVDDNDDDDEVTNSEGDRAAPSYTVTADPTELPTSDLTSISLSFCSQLEPRAVLSLAAFCPKLRSVNLTACCQLSDVCLEVLTRECQHLRYLDISSGSSFRLAKLTDHTLFAISKNCRQLEELHMKALFGVTMSGLESVVTCCEYLKWLSLTAGKNLPFGEMIQMMASRRCGVELWDAMGAGRLISADRYSSKYTGNCTFIMSRVKVEYH
ncbi:hypothetical protein LSH36_535g01016 [Paralvinella palmiformis]|uniref:F-box domain-containing protein n=1 Tax=Paralvinella palmiformis TaxID=53620 RepID=A0AAD9MXW8_9ANNE|nr:hypothetical protein LSH36_535g01016 [Paralvinella palmiformis]